MIDTPRQELPLQLTFNSPRSKPKAPFAFIQTVCDSKGLFLPPPHEQEKGKRSLAPP